jgi:hypothetical protein
MSAGSMRCFVCGRAVIGRRALIALSGRALHDIGIGRSEAWGEHAKPFWRS